MKPYLFILICLLNVVNAIGQTHNPYYMMGCTTPVLDYIERSDLLNEITKITLTDQTKAQIKVIMSANHITVISESNDTLAIYVNDGISMLRFISVDKLAEDNPGISPYAYCKGNPVCLIDPIGLKPTETEAARMADYVYQDDVVTLTGGWIPSSKTGYNFNQVDGLKTMLFERVLPDKSKEYALAFAGTDISNIIDFTIDALHDLFQTIGLSTQYRDAMALAKDFTSNYDNEITFVGHSLGGGLSAASAFTTNGQAITFNAAGVSPFTRFDNKVACIDAYITTNDPLDLIQRGLGLRANGKIILRSPKPNCGGHEIKNFY